MVQTNSIHGCVVCSTPPSLIPRPPSSKYRTGLGARTVEVPSVSVNPHATVWGTGGSGQNFLAAKFAARFRQKVFKKLDCVIVAGTNPSSYECVQGGAKLLRKAANIVDNIKKTKERKDRDNPDRDFAEFVEDKVYFQDTPWCPTFDVQYLNDGFF